MKCRWTNFSSACARFACILKALPIFTGGFVSIVLVDAVGRQVPEFMRQPVPEGVVAYIAVAIDEHASAGQVSEQFAGVAGRHVQVEGSGRVHILPVRHKENSQRINVGLHDPNLSSQQSLLFGRGSQDGVAVYGSSRRGRFRVDQLWIRTCLSPGELR